MPASLTFNLKAFQVPCCSQLPITTPNRVLWLKSFCNLNVKIDLKNGQVIHFTQSTSFLKANSDVGGKKKLSHDPFTYFDVPFVSLLICFCLAKVSFICFLVGLVFFWLLCLICWTALPGVGSMETQKFTRIIKLLFFQLCFICKCTGTHLPVVCWRTEMVLIEGGGSKATTKEKALQT